MIRIAIPRADQALFEVEKIKRQLPFATALGLNLLATDVRDTARDSLSRRFTIHPSRLGFMRGLINQEHRATKSEQWTRVGVLKEFGSGKGKDRTTLLTRHQEGGRRIANLFFIPTDEIRGGAYDVPPRRLYPTALGFKATTFVGHSPPSRVKGKGRRRKSYFMINPGAGEGDPKARGIFERFGKGKRDIRMIWALRPHIDLPPRLRFYETATKAVLDHWSKRFDEALKRALDTAR